MRVKSERLVLVAKQEKLVWRAKCPCFRPFTSHSLRTLSQQPYDKSHQLSLRPIPHGYRLPSCGHRSPWSLITAIGRLLPAAIGPHCCCEREKSSFGILPNKQGACWEAARLAHSVVSNFLTHGVVRFPLLVTRESVSFTAISDMDTSFRILSSPRIVVLYRL